MGPPPDDASTRSRRGNGSIREKRPGYWEIRVVVSSGPTVQRSFTFRGDREQAEARRTELVAEFARAGLANGTDRWEEFQAWRLARVASDGASVAQVVRAARVDCGLSRAALARRVGAPASLIASVEKGDCGDVGVLARVASALDRELVVALVPKSPLSKSTS